MGNNEILVLTLLGAIVICAVISWAISTKSKRVASVFAKVSALCIFIYAVVLAFAVTGELQPLSLTGMYVWSAVLVVLLVVSCIVFGNEGDFDARSLTFGAVCIATSFVLSFVKVHIGAGSVTLASLFPLALYGYMFGIRRGVVAGLVYGFLQFVQSPYVYHYVQVLLDYPLAFGMIGLAGIFANIKILQNKPTAQFICGTSIAVTLRYVTHVVSGYYFWGSYAKEGYTAFAWSAISNLTVFADFAIVCVVATALFASKGFCKVVLTQRNALFASNDK